MAQGYERMNNKDFEPIRVRIMQEAYELADRNDAEGYNAVKVMCGDVQKMLSSKREWVELTAREIELLDGMIEVQLNHAARCDNIANLVMAERQKRWDMERVELLRKLKETNT